MNRWMIAIVALGLAACEAPQPSATVQLEARSGSKVTGKLTLTQIDAQHVRVVGELSGHTPGPKGFHIHEKGDCSAADAMSTAGHFNPTGRKHGGPSGEHRHAGDLGNLTFDASGRAKVDLVAHGVSLTAGQPGNIVGRAFVVHAQTDDLKTDPTGNAGGRVACGVVRM